MYNNGIVRKGRRGDKSAHGRDSKKFGWGDCSCCGGLPLIAQPCIKEQKKSRMETGSLAENIFLFSVTNL